MSNLNNFKAELSRTDLLTYFDLSIDADPNRNYDILEHTITSEINKHLPTNKHKHKNANWITQGIIKSILGCNIGRSYIGVLGYADDLTLLSPSVNALSKMVVMRGICQGI